MVPKFKTISISIELHNELSKLSEELTDQSGMKVSIPNVIEYLRNEYAKKTIKKVGRQ